MNGWTVSTNSGSATINESIIIEAGSRAVFGIQNNLVLTLGVELDWAWGLGNSISLDNASDKIKIIDSEGYTVDSLEYGSDHPFAAGISMELTNPLLDNDNTANWVAGSVSYDSENNLGSPGDVNDGLINVPGIQMNPAVGNVGSVYFEENGSGSINAIIYNSGEANLTISSIINDPLVLNDNNVFTYDLPSLPLTIDPGNGSQLTITLHAYEIGSYADSLLIISDAARDDSLYFRVEGIVGIPILQHTDNKLADVFADSVLVPASGTAHTPITNTGGYPLIISEVNFFK